MPDDPDWRDWREGRRFDPKQRWSEWYDLVRATTSRGVEIRRARIVSEPISDYVRFEYDVTADHNIAAGEQVRWLGRQNAVDLIAPVCDLWVFDSEIVVFNIFDGNNGWIGEDRHDDPALAKSCADAFEAVWQRAVPHEAYQPD
jgi:hypothetical protein